MSFRIIHFVCLFLVLVIFSSCSESQDLELEIVTNKINSLVINPEKYGDVMASEDSLYSIRFKKAKTIVMYKLKNNSSKTYFFNIGAFEKELTNKNGIILNNAFVTIYDAKNNNIKVKKSFPSRFANSDELKYYLLNYDSRFYHKSKNFIIHPNEIIYFEWFIVLPFGCMIEEPVSMVNFNPNEKYNVELSITSLNNPVAQKYLSRSEIEMIKKNGYEIFNGTIKSKNRVPIKFIK